MATSLESILRIVGAIAGIGTLGYSIYNMLLAQARPTGQQTGAARQVLRTPYLIIATLLFLAAGYTLWKPLPIQLSQTLGLILSLAGAFVLLCSLALYVWGLQTLGSNFNASSGFGVRLHQSHQLVTSGPYAFSRHPMYLGVISAGLGGLALYRTWTMLIFALLMFGLIIRARREEEALSIAFGSEWEQYQRSVPAWLPRLANLLRIVSH